MNAPLKIMLADDDADDRFFFDETVKSASTPAVLNTVDNGEKLMVYLKDNESLPDILFLDMNMPRKNGSECLLAIKQDDKLKNLPVIIYSTSLHKEIADVLFNNGAHYYIKKGNSAEMQGVVNYVLMLMTENKLSRPDRGHFILHTKHLNLKY